jgi:hypothetical protein
MLKLNAFDVRKKRTRREDERAPLSEGQKVSLWPPVNDAQDSFSPCTSIEKITRGRRKKKGRKKTFSS